MSHGLHLFAPVLLLAACASHVVTPDAGGDAADVVENPRAPRLIAPLSTSRVTRRRPTLHWQLASGTDTALVEICRDRACTGGPTHSLMASGDHGTLTADLTPGVHHWRARGMSGGVAGSATSPTWEFLVPRVNGSTDTSFDSLPDYNGDGIGDLAFGVGRTSDDSASVVYAYFGRAGAFPSAPDVTFAVANVSTVANLGDVDGDGFADLGVRIIGAGSPERIDVHLGGPSGPSTTSWMSIRWSGGNLFGLRTVALGDVNGDGYADFATESPLGAMSGGFGRRVEIFHGGRTLGAPASAVEGGGEWTGMGPPAPIGDIDGDGFADMAIAERAGYVMGNPFALIPAVVHVFRGGPAGLDTAHPVNLSSPAMDDSAFGGLGDRASDFDADGHCDLVVMSGAHSSPDGTVNYPAGVYVYAGRAGFTATAPSVTFVPLPGDPRFFGPGGLAAGDLDADGRDDLVVVTSVPTGALIQIAHGSATGLPTSSTEYFTLANAGHTYFMPHRPRDLDGDGIEDLAGTVATVLGSSTTPAMLGFSVFRGHAGAALDTVPAATVVVPTTDVMDAFEWMD